MAGSMRAPGLEVKPGTVRRARAEAGLSLAGLAQGDVSRTALHLIESGKTRPTLKTLQLIASRTGRPLEYFLKPGQEKALHESDLELRRRELDLVEHEILLGEWHAALERCRRIDARYLPDQDRARRDLLLGQLLVQLGEPDAAVPVLEKALATFELENDHVHVAEALCWLAGAKQALEDPASLATAQRALEVSRRLEPPAPSLELRILNRLGAIYDAQQRWDDAIKTYELALSRTSELRDLPSLARMYNGVSIAYASIGNHEDARRHLHKAIAIHEMLRDRLSIASAENNLGNVYLELGRRTDAHLHFDRSLQICEEDGIEHGRAHVLLSLAKLSLGGGALDDAEQAASQAAELAERLGETSTNAECLEVLGQAAAQRGDDRALDLHFQRALAILEGLGVAARLTTSHARYADALESRGRETEAAAHWKLAVQASHPTLVRSAARKMAPGRAASA